MRNKVGRQVARYGLWNHLAWLTLSLLSCCLMLIACGGGGGGDGSAPAPAPTTTSGQYQGTGVNVNNSSDTGLWQMNFTQNGAAVTGTVVVSNQRSYNITGTMSGNIMTFVGNSGPNSASCTSILDGSQISGNCIYSDGNRYYHSGTLRTGQALNAMPNTTQTLAKTTSDFIGALAANNESAAVALFAEGTQERNLRIWRALSPEHKTFFGEAVKESLIIPSISQSQSRLQLNVTFLDENDHEVSVPVILTKDSDDNWKIYAW